VEADPELPEAHASRGLALGLVTAPGDETQWAPEFDSALRLRPGSFDVLYLYGRTCLAEGEFAKAAELLDQARAARPDDFHALTLLSKALRGAGDQAAATAAAAQALAQIEYHLRLVPDDLRAHSDGVCALVEVGRHGEALAWADRVWRMAGSDPMLYYVACGLARAGRRDRALAALADVIDAGFSHARWLRHDPDWSDLRGDAAFQRLLQRVDQTVAAASR
jgi:adenylate cyclase